MKIQVNGLMETLFEAITEQLTTFVLSDFISCNIDREILIKSGTHHVDVRFVNATDTATQMELTFVNSRKDIPGPVYELSIKEVTPYIEPVFEHKFKELVQTKVFKCNDYNEDDINLWLKENPHVTFISATHSSMHELSNDGSVGNQYIATTVVYSIPNFYMEVK